MDEWLAQVYQTDNGSGDNFEKIAQDRMLQKLCEEEGIDLSGLSEEELAAVAQEVAGDQGDGQSVEGSEPEGEEAEGEELQAKFAEADFLGRVMAHSYTQELTKIAEAGGLPPALAAQVEKKVKKEEKKEEEEEGEEKTGALASAIQRLGGSVEGPAMSDQAAAYVEKLAEARAEELAVGWLREQGLVE